MFANVFKPARNRRSTLGRPALVCGAMVAMLALGGCGGNMEDLERYIDEVKSKPGQRPEPLPEIKPYETFTYNADTDGFRAPFSPDTPSAASGSATGPRPDDNRSREYLEQFPIDSFTMVGTLALGGTSYGLVQDREGRVHRVVPGNYIGENDGRITAVNEAEISITEIVSNGIGGYIERDVAIALPRSE